MSTQIAHVLEETRSFPPPPEFQRRARVQSREQYEEMYRRSVEDPDGFWGDIAQEFHWFKRWDRVLNPDNAPFFKWFEGGLTNISYNCLDRHLQGERRTKRAIIWEGEPGDTRTLTYEELHQEVCQFANCLKQLGLKKGDRVAIYMPMIPELPVAMLACARIGAVHSVIFGGFSANAIVDRVHDFQACMIITADGGWRRGHVVELKK
ncbi:MAG: AMP-binding protein, partial [Candidatus Hydrogenedentes bacterium]|nr:AMP-binding protein [Candidatus Hydrogenedentota bacterium]